MQTSFLTNDDLKKELIYMLKQLCEYLDSHNLRYSITSGTLLGAVRHKGFIPWDDDIDMGLLREDYDKFVSFLKLDNKIGDNLRGIGFELGETHMPYIKIVNPLIKTEEKVIDNIYDKGHLWIDVFPFDGVPNFWGKGNTYYLDKILRKFYEKKRISIEFPQMLGKSKSDILIKRLNFDKLTRFYIKECSKFSKKKCDLVRDYTWGNKSIPRSLFDNILEYNFESLRVKGFADYDKYLSILYGDYMELPPEEKRVNHGIKAWYE